MKGLLRASLSEHWQRYIATAVAIMLATGFMLTCLGVTGGFYASMERALAGNTRGADVVVTLDEDAPAMEEGSDASVGDEGGEVAGGGSGVETGSGDSVQVPASLRDLYAALEKQSDLAYSRAVYTTFMSLRSGSQGTQAAVASLPTKPFEAPELRQGAYPKSDDEVTLDQSSANSLGVSVGDKVSLEEMTRFRIDAQGRPVGEEPQTRELKVTGITVGAVTFYSQALVTPQLYRDFVEASLPANYQPQLLLLSAKPGVSQSELVSQIQQSAKQLGLPIKVMPQAEYVSKQLDGFTGGAGIMTALLLIFPVLSTLVAIIVVSITFQVLLAQRKRELALLRAIGATRSQIRSLVRREALVVGVVSALLGIALGVAGATAANLLSGLTVNLSESLGAFSAWHFVVSFSVGVVTTLLGSSAPARRIAQVSPMEALHPEDAAYVQRRRAVFKSVLAALAIILGAGVVAFGYSLGAGTDPSSDQLLMRFVLMFFGSLLSFVGVLIALQLLTPSLTLWSGKLLGRGSVVADLGAENTRRNPGRTGATVTALTMGITLVATMLVGSTSLRETVNQVLVEKAPVDFVAVSEQPISTDSLDAIRTSAGVQAVTLGDTVNVEVKDSAADDSVAPVVRRVHTVELNAKNSRGALSGVKDDEVWVSGWNWDQEWTDSTRVQLSVGGVKLSLRPVLVGVPGLTVSPANFQRLEQGAKLTVPVSTDTTTKPTQATPTTTTGGREPGTDPGLVLGQITHENTTYIMMEDQATTTDMTALSATLNRTLGQSEVQGNGANRIMVNTVVSALTWGIVAMLAISVLVALVGVANTLALSVVERRRENGILRAVGMTRRGLKLMMAFEALLIGLVGSITGVVLGLLYGCLGLLALPFESSSGVQIVFSVPWWQLGTAVAIAVLAALLASWIPGRNAAKASPIAALTEAV